MGNYVTFIIVPIHPHHLFTVRIQIPNLIVDFLVFGKRQEIVFKGFNRTGDLIGTGIDHLFCGG